MWNFVSHPKGSTYIEGVPGTAAKISVWT